MLELLKGNTFITSSLQTPSVTVCEPPPSLNFSTYNITTRVYYDNLIEGVVITYTCDENYFFGGNNLLECASNGTWSGDIGSCYRSKQFFYNYK